MSKFEELKPNAAVRGILPDGFTSVVSELLPRGDLNRRLVVCTEITWLAQQEATVTLESKQGELT